MACLWGASVFSFIALFALLAVYGERKISAFIHDRLGPTVTGPKGLFQTFADILKLLSKENIMPDAAEKVLFIIAPLLVFLPVFIGFSVLPVGKGFGVAFPNSGVLFLVAVVSIEVIGIWIAGWASGNKYALLGSARAIAQMVSYEIPALLAILSAVIMYGTFDLEKICQAQYSQSGVLAFGVFKYPFLWISFVLYFICTLAETNRSPFDMPEAESELLAGFHIEYSGFRFALMFLAEYANMLLLSLLAVLLFFGGYNSPIPFLGEFDSGTIPALLWGLFWLLSKGFLLVFIQIWLRWSLPRIRIDQLMFLCWKVLTPAGLVLFFISCIWKLTEVYSNLS